jgi:EAL domain-containing protein (putative c-di-GMP-specific phosphodiesterase class I)
VVAEGVETAQQHHEVAALGCDSCRDYYFARPMPATNLETLIQANNDGTRTHLPLIAAPAA